MKLKELVDSYPNKRTFISAVKSELVKLAEENKEFTYHNPKNYMLNKDEICNYNKGPDSSPRRCNGCIFGQALKNLGWTDRGERSITCSIKELFSGLTELKVPKYWSKIQEMNDNNKPWGEFLKVLKPRKG